MEPLVTINLCMGSSCFARGNDRLLESLERAVQDSGWGEKVYIAGSRCENRCGGGPNVFVDGELYQGADVGVILDVIESKLSSTTNQ